MDFPFSEILQTSSSRIIEVEQSKKVEEKLPLFCLIGCPHPNMLCIRLLVQKISAN